MKKMAKRLKFVAVLLLALVTVLGTVFTSSAESAGAKESVSASNDDIVVVWADSDDSTSGIAISQHLYLNNQETEHYIFCSAFLSGE